LLHVTFAQRTPSVVQFRADEGDELDQVLLQPLPDLLFFAHYPLEFSN
jgi:hypothetical protein